MLTTHITAAAVAVTVGMGVILPAVDRNYPVEFIERSIVEQEVAPGGQVLVRIALKRTEVCQTTSHFTIFDGAGIEVAYIEDDRPAWGPITDYEERTQARFVPAWATPGPAIYRVVLSFECNWTQNIVPLTMVLPDLHFTITDGQPDPRLP